MSGAVRVVPSTLVGKAVVHYRAGGVGRVLRIAARKAVRALVVANSAVWYRLECGADTENGPPPAPTRGSALGFGLEERERFERWARANAAQFPYIFDEREASRDRQDDVLWYALRDESTIVAFVQIGVGRVFVRDFGRHIRLPVGTAFIQQVFCAPVRRGQGCATLLLQRAVGELRRNRLITQVFCHIPSWNRPSIALHLRLGFAPVGRVTYVRLLGLPLFTRHPERLVGSYARRAAA